MADEHPAKKNFDLNKMSWISNPYLGSIADPNSKYQVAGPAKFYSVVIDNSAMNNLLNSDDLTSGIEERLKRNVLRLIVPDDAIQEAASGSNLDFMHGRLAKLGRLVRCYPDNVILAKESGSWLRYEWINGGVLRNIPHRRNGQRFKGVVAMLERKAELERIHAGVENARLEARQRKIDLTETDQRFRDRCIAELPKGEPLEMLKSIKDRVPLGSLASLPLAFSFLPGFSKTKFRRAFYSKSRFRMLKCYISLMYVRTLANAVDPTDCPLEFEELIKIKKGNWYDLGLIAAAAFQDHLISDDSGQRVMTEFAKERGIVKCSAIKLTEFLALPG